MKKSQDAVQKYMGFTLERRPSLLKDGGMGVFVVGGPVPKHSLVAFYPGTVYRPGDSVFLQSIMNKFVLRCVDGTLVDGNDKGLSRLVYR